MPVFPETHLLLSGGGPNLVPLPVVCSAFFRLAMGHRSRIDASSYCDGDKALHTTA